MRDTMKMMTLIMLAVLLATSQAKDFQVMIDFESETGYEVGPLFVGVTIDSHIFRRSWKYFHISSRPLQTLAKGLYPSRVRIGGSDANFMIFQENGEPQYDGRAKYSNFTVTGAQWKKMIDFLRQAGWSPIFAFNQFLRRQNGKWDPENARQLLEYSQKLNFPIPYFQIGNEASSYHLYYDFTISGSRLPEDMKQLRKLLSEFKLYNDSGIVGPDITRVTRHYNENWLKVFLKNGGGDVVSMVGLHHYYLTSREANLTKFTDINVLNRLKDQNYIARKVVNSLAPNLPICLTETSSVSSGGLDGVTDRYVAGFLWLDKLGLSALMGLKGVFRQSFIRGRYALISDGYDPYPDYFLTLLYKKLVQGKVFNVTTSTDEVRVYASCANPDTYEKGALTVYVLNVKNETVTLSFPQYADQMYDLYLLTPEIPGNLTSANVQLNGKTLRIEDNKLPDLEPKVTDEITFPSKSFGFVVIPDERHC